MLSRSNHSRQQSNASTHTLFLSLGLEPTKIVGYSVQILFKGDKNQGGVFVQTANFFPSFASAALARSSHSVCADERISQGMKQHPSLGSLKRSADHYAVQSPYRGRVEAKRHKQAKPKNNKFLSKLQTGFQCRRNSEKRSTEDQKLSFGSQTVEIFPNCSNNVRFPTKTSQLSTTKRDECNRSVGCAR